MVREWNSFNKDIVRIFTIKSHIEIGSRGLICKENASKLLNLVKKVKKSNGKEFRSFKSDLTKVTVIASYIIFYFFENQ